MKNLKNLLIALMIVTAGTNYVQAQKNNDNNSGNENSVWLGEWDTEWDGANTVIITLTEKNDKIQGSYNFKNGMIAAQSKKENAKFILAGTWKQSNNSIGWFIFTMNSTNNGFTGQWGYLGNSEAKGNWNGTRKGSSDRGKTNDEGKKNKGKGNY